MRFRSGLVFLAVFSNCIFGTSIHNSAKAKDFKEEVFDIVNPKDIVKSDDSTKPNEPRSLNFGSSTQSIPSFYVSPREQLITEEELQKKDSLFVSDAISKITSVQAIGHPLGGVTPSLFLRGANSEFTQVLWNGLSLNDSTSVSGGADFLSINREFSSQVRVLRGPETLYYGPESLSGLILLERVEFRDQKIKLSLSEYSTGELQLEKRKDFANSRLLFGASLFGTDGISNVVDKSSIFERDRKSQNSITAIYENENHERQLQVLFNYFSQRTEDDLFVQEDVNAFSKTQDIQGFVQIRSPFRIFDLDFQQQFEASLSRIERSNINPPDEFNPSSYQSEYEGRQLKIKEALVLEKERTKSWFGIDYVGETMQSLEHYNQLESDHFSQDQNNLSLFAISSFPSIADSRVELGARFDQDLTRALQLQWQKNGYYGLVASGYKTPSIYQKFSSYGNPDLKTQKSILFEVGGSWLLRTGFTARSAIYTSQYEELISFTVNRFNNFAKVKSQGAESEINWQGRQTDLKFSIQYNEIFQLDPIRVLARRPRWVLRSDVERKVGDSFRGGLESEWQSSRLDFDTIGSELTLPSYSLFHGKVSYQWGRSGAGATGKIGEERHGVQSPQNEEKLVLRLNNLFDAAYQQAYGYSSPGRFVSLSYQLNN